MYVGTMCAAGNCIASVQATQVSAGLQRCFPRLRLPVPRRTAMRQCQLQAQRHAETPFAQLPRTTNTPQVCKTAFWHLALNQSEERTQGDDGKDIASSCDRDHWRIVVKHAGTMAVQGGGAAPATALTTGKLAQRSIRDFSLHRASLMP